MYIREFVNVNKKDKEELPFDIEDDIVVYMRNDPMFYRKHYYPVLLKMQSAYQSNRSQDAVSLWTPVVRRAVVPYINKFKINKKVEDVVDANKIKTIANKIYSDEIDNIKRGLYK